MKLGPIDFTQPSTWRGIVGIAGVFGFAIKPEIGDQIAVAVAAGLSAIEMFRNEYATRKATVQIELQSRPAAVDPTAVDPERLRPSVPTLAETPSEPETLRNPESPGFGDR